MLTCVSQNIAEIKLLDRKLHKVMSKVREVLRLNSSCAIRTFSLHLHSGCHTNTTEQESSIEICTLMEQDPVSHVRFQNIHSNVASQAPLHSNNNNNNNNNPHPFSVAAKHSSHQPWSNPEVPSSMSCKSYTIQYQYFTF